MPFMTSPLNSAEQDEINTFLKRIKGGRLRSFSALDGLFAAIVCAPDMIMPSEYLPVIIQGSKKEDDLDFRDEEEAARFFHLIQRHYNTVLNEIRDWGEIKDDDLIFYNPSLLEDDNGNLLTEDWANGFLIGTDLRYEDWRRFTEVDRYGVDEENPLLSIMLLAYENHPDMCPLDKPMTNEVRWELMAFSVIGIKKIYAEFSGIREAAMSDRYGLDVETGMFVRDKPKAGRNNPCPCGSGKKYKKCCAALKIAQ